MRFAGCSRATLAMLLLMAVIGICADTSYVTCTGSDPCRACKDCSRCKHCGRDSGRCGVCKRHRVSRLEEVTK